MAFVVANRRGGFEIRESQNTAKGPRSRTLATFRGELTDSVIEKARARSAKALNAEELRTAAGRAGALNSRRPVDRAARELIAELAKGQRIDPALEHLLLDLLPKGKSPRGEQPLSDAAHSMAAWMASTPRDRGQALVDLLLLADAVPSNGRRRKPLEFPRLDSLPDG